MNTDVTGTALAAILDALTLVQGQLDTMARSNARIEATQTEIMGRLDLIDAGQAWVTDLVPVLEAILARSIEDRDLTREQFATVATIAGFAHAAASGNPAPLPVDIADDRLLERFALTQPADRMSEQRAIVEWRRVASCATLDELVDLLSRQYRPSPSDTPETRVLRYRLAAITRSEIEGRGAGLPSPPTSTLPQDISVQARNAKSEELARLWRAGESTVLFAEPELAGALDVFATAERRGAGGTDEKLSVALAQLHKDIAYRLSIGERPTGWDATHPITTKPALEFTPHWQRRGEVDPDDQAQRPDGARPDR